eukprot:TRINITY_DN22541_c0_g1_i1.p1 TRINITY_DN22541_c0_g1~~TRINITY_DN22541_c0_g1_i1.p1  ORF type:complete len:345 (-),score=41.20 TRINITY_DN22541_c0_g1_i1:753-1787(-)
MAGIGQKWFAPLTWPLGYILTAAQAEKMTPQKPQASPQLDLNGHLTSFAGSTRSFLLAYICIYWAYDGYDYPAFGRAGTWSLSWMWPIFARNLLATWIICGFWDWFLYFSPMKDRLKKFKFNHRYPPMGQFIHDAMATTVASICGSFVEVLLCHLWSTGALAMPRSIMDAPVRTLFWAITMTHWRIPHFWLLHRALHPWYTTSLPDVGKFLYRYVHAQHHKSYLPTAFSGTNMHIVEATGYYAMPSMFMAWLVGLHPTVAVGCIIDCGVGAWLGHDGFQWPGSGDYFHQLHHEHFDCNYGAMHVPIDKWMGTYVGSKEEIKAVWGAKKAGREANLQDTKIWDCK